MRAYLSDLFTSRKLSINFICALLLSCGLLAAGNVRALDIPPALSPWQGWVLDKHPDAKCTRLAADINQRRCVWPGRLVLTVNERGGSFGQNLQAESAGWSKLPGDREHWPVTLMLNGKSISALEHEGTPALWLEAGDYVLRGNFEWKAMPQSLSIPADTALLDLNLNGVAVADPNRDSVGRLWLRAQNDVTESGTHDSVKVEVFRKIEDELPRTVDTVLRLSVSGKARELKLGRLLLKNAESIGFVSPLPARIEDDGSLRVQARAGTWEIRLRARLLSDDNSFAIERQSEDWPAQEVWSFAANQALRRVKVDGAPSVDPSQLDLPADFNNLPTYLLDAQTTLKLDQQYRGDATPAPNELTLQRTVWLDFESGETGNGATVKDAVTGKLSKGWRLESQPDVKLGRVRVNGEPQLVTQLQKDGASGVEIRDPNVNVEAISRVESIDKLNAAGWQTDFNGVQMTLQLPPGWKLWHASGPDQVNDSWVSRWNLWAIFLSLLIVGTVFRLLDWRWALVATATVALVYHENFALIILLLPLLVVIALLKVVAAPNARLWIQRVGYGFGILLVLVIVVFAVNQIRRAIYPQLEVPYSIADVDQSSVEPQAASSPKLFNALSEETSSRAPAQAITTRVLSAEKPKRYQASNNVQTGPGEPQWNWQPTTLSWSGPVKADQPLHLYLTGPWLTRLLKFFDVILVVALAVGIFSALIRTRPEASAKSNNSNSGITALSLWLVMGLSVMGYAVQSPAAHADEFPPKSLLDELEKRLVRAPACAPNCAATESALVQINNGLLSIKLRVSVGADLAMALPGANNWQPRSILVDGLAVNTAARGNDGVALLPLAKGHHELTLEGPVNSDDITLQFSDHPHVIRVSADDWDIFGVNGSLLSANSLQLQKRQRSAQQDTLLPATDKPFVRIYRDFNFDLDWTVTTTVERVAPQQGAINISVLTLPGESIVDGGVEAKDGRVAISLGSQQQQLSWNSQLKPEAKLQLSAPQTTQAVEVWRVNASPRWHVEGEGLIGVKGNGESIEREWRPWPGETLTLNARQPLAVNGPTTTVESSAIKLVPGKRSSSLEAKLIITSSIGGDYQVVLREPAELKTTAVNGSDISQARNDDKLVLPLTPGRNEVLINWELQRGAELVTRTPALTLATVGNNINLSLQIPPDRWPLWVSGPRIGPAMLYWGVLAVIVGVAFALTFVTRRFALGIPLPSWHWLLLFIGMSTVNVVGSLPVLLWFFALEARRHYFEKQKLPKGDLYYLVQVGIVMLSLLALIALIAVIPQSLLSAPDMQVTGNGSENYFFNWYQDRSGENLPQAQVISIPLWCYRVTMLAWSLWLVFALLRWVKWGWTIFAEGGVWPQRENIKPSGSDDTKAKT